MYIIYYIIIMYKYSSIIFQQKKAEFLMRNTQPQKQMFKIQRKLIQQFILYSVQQCQILCQSPKRQEAPSLRVIHSIIAQKFGWKNVIFEKKKKWLLLFLQLRLFFYFTQELIHFLGQKSHSSIYINELGNH